MAQIRKSPRDPLRLNSSLDFHENDDDQFSKKYYKIQDVAEFVGVTPSTIRFWETQFDTVRPSRSAGNVRYYSPDDIRQLRMIHYLVKEKGMKLEVAKEQLKKNPKNISRRIDVIAGLTQVRDELKTLLAVMEKRR